MGPITLDSLELGGGSLDVEIEFSYTPADPVTLTQRCGYDPRGAPANIDLMDVRAVTWDIDGKSYKRSDHWVWTLLDAYAMTVVCKFWDDYYNQCITHVTLEN